MNLMVLATVRMRIPLKKRVEAVEILNAVAERTRFQPGCLSCRIYHDEQVEAVFMVEEVWESQENLDRHLRSEDYRNVLFVTEMAVEPPEIRFEPHTQRALRSSKRQRLRQRVRVTSDECRGTSNEKKSNQ
jgi:quinol monooxygenase YgiN